MHVWCAQGSVTSSERTQAEGKEMEPRDDVVCQDT